MIMASKNRVKKILWIDDDAHGMQFLVDFIEFEGFEVEFVQSNDAALNCLMEKNKQFDLIIQDVERPPGECLEGIETDMGRRSGIEFFKLHIRRFAPRTPVIFLTTHFPDDEIAHLVEKYGCKYVYRNTSRSEVLSIVNSIFESTKKIYEDSFTKEQLRIIRPDFEEINEELVKYLASHPEYLYQLNSRRFEELIAHLLDKVGYSVTLTQKTRDGAKDIYAIQKSEVGDILSVVECKRYSPDKLVGVSVVRSLYAVKVAERANVGVVMTTSFFTNPAIEFKNHVGSELSLKDYNYLVEWLKKFK